MRKAFKITGKIVLWIIALAFALFVVLILLIRLPSVQNYITHKVIHFVSIKTHTKIQLERLYIGFPKSIVLQGFFAEDLKHDTLVYLKQLEIDINLTGLLNNKAEVNNLFVNKLNLHIKRNLPDSSFNFDFFIDAFKNKNLNSTKDTLGVSWTIIVNKILLQNIRASFEDGVSSQLINCTAGEIQVIPEKIDLVSQQIKIKKLYIKETDIQMLVENATIPADKNLNTTNNGWQILVNQTALSNIRFKFDNVHYPKLSKGIDFNHLFFTGINLEMKDAFYNPGKISANINQLTFKEQCGLKLTQLKADIILMNGKINTRLKDLFVSNLLVHTEQATSISLDAHITGLPDVKTAVYDIRLKTLATKKQDLLFWIPQKKLPVTVPESILLKGHFKGTLNDFATQLDLQSSSGNLNLTAAIKMTSSDTFYKAAIQTKNLDLGYLLNQPAMIGPLSVNAGIKGKNFSYPRMKAELHAVSSSVSYDKYKVHHISLQAHSDKGKIESVLKINDPNLKLQLLCSLTVKANQKSVLLNMNLDGADLKKLKITSENIRSSGKLNLDLKGKTIEEMSGRIHLNNIVVIKDGKKYSFDSILMITENDKKHSLFKMESGILNIDYAGTLTLPHIQTALTKHVNQYFSLLKDTIKTTGLMREQDFKLEVQIIPHPFLNEVLLPGLEKFNGATLKADFNTNRDALNLVFFAPLVQYKNTLLSDLNLEVHSNTRSLNYAFSINSFQDGNIRLPLTKISGQIENKVLSFSLQVIHKDSGNKLLIAGDLKQEAGRNYLLHIKENLVFNNMKWQMTPDNYIRFINKGIYVHHFEMSNQDQRITMNTAGSNETGPLMIQFKKFELATLSQIAEKDTAIIRGEINGSFEVRNLQKSPAFISDLNISNIVYMENTIGNLSIVADNLSAGPEGKYSAKILLSGQDNKAVIQGTYFANNNQNLDFNMDIDRLNLKSIEGFTAGKVRQTSGYLNGKIHIGGTGNKPEIKGYLGFKDATFNIAYMNTDFTIKDEHIKIDPAGIYFSSFTIRDALGQKAIVDGAVYTKDFRKMKFNLTVKTNTFTVLNTSLRDNPLYFGKVLMSSTIRIKGDESMPEIYINAKLLAGSQLTFVVPASQLNTDIGEGVVVFIDTNTADHIMGRIDTVLIQNVFKGIDLTANVEISRESTFKVIVDRNSGDSLVVKGDGLFSFSIDPTGKQSLTGTYNLNSGSYNSTFQKVIKRNFKIKPGSTITWSGSLVDATLDITAIYRIRTAPADLLSNELSGSLLSERNAYRKPMYFEVNMIMKGALMKPEITFMLNLDDKDKNAFGGSVYAKVNSLNNDPAELNKQVFALLVLNKFVPAGAPSNSGENNAVNTMARNSVNQILGDQLNQISDKYIKNVELNFDVKSNDQYTETSIKQNTEVQVGLKKEFLNKRMSVQIGSNINVQNNGSTTTNASNLTGDMVLEYKITEDGRYRFKAFRENQYAGIIDGLLYKTGIGIIYIRDFDTLQELFTKPEEVK